MRLNILQYKGSPRNQEMPSLKCLQCHNGDMLGKVPIPSGGCLARAVHVVSGQLYTCLYGNLGCSLCPPPSEESGACLQCLQWKNTFLG